MCMCMHVYVYACVRVCASVCPAKREWKYLKSQFRSELIPYQLDTSLDPI